MITTLRIGGMTCNGCVRHVREALRGVPGVSAVDVYLEAGQAKVDLDPSKSSVTSLVEVVRAAGYTADPVPVDGTV